MVTEAENQRGEWGDAGLTDRQTVHMKDEEKHSWTARWTERLYGNNTGSACVLRTLLNWIFFPLCVCQAVSDQVPVKDEGDVVRETFHELTPHSCERVCYWNPVIHYLYLLIISNRRL